MKYYRRSEKEQKSHRNLAPQKYDGLESDEVPELKQALQEISRRKRLAAECILAKPALQDVPAEKATGLRTKSRLQIIYVRNLSEGHAV